VPHFNVINGGAHAANPLDFQEFMIAPLGAPSLPEAIRAGAEIYGQLTRILIEHDLATGLGDEGGFAPDISTPEQALTFLCQAIDRSGYRTGTDGVAIALDPAASEMFDGEHYRVGTDLLSSQDMVDRYAMIVEKFPVWSIEDGVAETDTAGWQALTAALGDRIQLVGDDNFVTDAALIADGADSGVANAALIKVNQVGTVTETLAALNVCRERGYAAMVSHRSGETTDTFIADLAVGCGCGQLKAGAPARGERVAKYNRLLQIAHAAPHLPFGVPDPLRP
jgi:enolase